MTPLTDPASSYLLFDRMPTALLILDAQQSLSFINACAARLLGFSATGDLGHALGELWPALAEALKADRNGQAAFEVPGPASRGQTPEPGIDGLDRWYECQIFSLGGLPDGFDLGLGLQVREVSGRRREQRELNELRQTVENSPDCICTLSLEGRILTVNAQGLRTLEITEDGSGLGMLWQTFWKEGARQDAETAVMRARGGESSTFEGEARTLAGTRKWWEVSVSPLRAGDGSVNGLLAVSRDVTPRQLAQISLLNSEERWRKLVEASPLGIVVTAPNGKVLHVNAAYAALLGYSQAEFRAGVGDWRAVTPTEFQAADTAAVQAVLNGRPVQSYEKEVFDRHGARIPVRVVLVRDELPGDGPEHGGRAEPALLSYLQDLRPYRVAEQTLRDHGATLWRQVEERTAELEEQNAALNAFTHFTEVSALTTDPATLTEQVRSVLHAALGPVQVDYSDVGQGSWEQWFTAGGPVFRNDAPPAAFYPYFGRAGQPSGLLTVTRATDTPWNERQRSIVQSVGLSLGLALERAGIAQQLQLQNDELDLLARALQGFADLTRDLSFDADPHLLISKTQEMVLSLLPTGYALYYEPEADGQGTGNRRWMNRVQSGSVGNEGLQTFIDAGPPIGQTPSIDHPWETQRPFYQDEYLKGSDTGLELVAHVNTAATLPVLVNHKVVGVLVFCLFERRPWKASEKTVMETVTHQLGLAMQRAEQARQIEEERAALEAFTSFSEAVGSESDVSLLIERASGLLKHNRDVDVMYFGRGDREGTDLFQLRTWPSNLPDDLLTRALQGYSPQQPSFAQAEQLHRAVFFDHWRTVPGHLPEAEVYGAVAFQPFFQEGRMSSVLMMACRTRSTWSEREQGIFRAVGRSLNLALERAEAVTTLARHSQALERGNDALSAANEELEAFAYSASHDLRTPVRHILAFTDLASKALSNTPNEKAQGHLNVVKQAGERMNTLIDAMLVLSRAGRKEFTPRMVDLSALLSQARRDVGTEFPGRPIRWTGTEPLPAVWGDAAMLQQVLTNLLSNAVKYSAKRDVSLVEVRVESHPSEWRLSVRDNGAGFNPQYAQKLFGVFQRLHNAREFEGTGVGLATVRRIVLKHGGRVFAESVPGEGATFGFTLPRPGERRPG